MATDERLEKIEHQLARIRWSNRCLIGCIALCLGGWFIMNTLGPETAFAQSGIKEIRANKFILEDENGKIRAELYTSKDKGGGLRLYDESGKLRYTLGVAKQGIAQMLLDENQTARIVLGANQEGQRLNLFDENGQKIWSAP